MNKYLSVAVLFFEITVSAQALAQTRGMEFVADILCTENQYIEGNVCAACPANAVCNGRTATCKKNMVTIHQDGKIICKRTPVATVQNGKVKKQCRQESHIGIDWIKTRYKNCVKCGTINVAAKKCPNNPKPHRHYYCDCAC